MFTLHSFFLLATFFWRPQPEISRKPKQLASNSASLKSERESNFPSHKLPNQSNSQAIEAKFRVYRGENENETRKELFWPKNRQFQDFFYQTSNSVSYSKKTCNSASNSQPKVLEVAWITSNFIATFSLFWAKLGSNSSLRSKIELPTKKNCVMILTRTK